MVTIQSMQREIINTVLKITDFETLKNVKARLMGDSMVEKYSGIPTVNIQYGVTLDEIREQQKIEKITFEEIEEMFREEEWDKPLLDLMVD